MLNVTDHYCISPATSKGGFPVIRVICHESVIYVTGHVSHRSEAQGLLPRITRQSETILIKLMLIIRFKPIAYSWLLSKTIGLVNLVINFPGLLLPLFLTEQEDKAISRSICYIIN